MHKILVVEDEADIAELIRFNLELAKYKVTTAGSGEEALEKVDILKPDLILLDLMLPGLSGLEVCRRLKQDSKPQDFRIIMVTAKGEESDIVQGLELGADDYVTKPFSPQVLLARVQAVLRRARPVAKEEPVDGVIRVGSLEVDPGRVEVAVDGEKVDLTQSEFRILQFLAQRPGWVYTRAQIVQAIHGANYAVTDRTIDFQMVGLRKKLGAAGEYIETVRGVGYRFKDMG